MEWWFAQLFRYAVLCLIGWTIGGVLLGESVAFYVLGCAFFWGPCFGVPTGLVLVGLHLGRRRLDAARFRLLATVLIPLVPVLLPLDVPPAELYGDQLLVQAPIHVAFAWWVRPPVGVTPSPARGPAAYTLPATALVWLALLLTLGYPALWSLVPLGPRQPAEPVAGPAEHVRVAAGGGPHLLYRAGPDNSCRYDGTRGEEGRAWIWNRPAAEVTHDGRVYRYAGVVPDDEFGTSCDDGAALVNRYVVGPSPMRAVVAAGVLLPILGIVCIAWARRRARR